MTRDAQTALMDALAAYLGPLSLTTAKVRDWASATFVGTQHHIELSLADDDTAACKIAALPDIDLPMRGRFVADLRLVTVHAHDGRFDVVLEALVVEDGQAGAPMTDLTSMNSRRP